MPNAGTAADRRARLVSYQLYPLYFISLAETDGGDPVAGERIARELVHLAEEFDWSWAGTAPLRALANALEAQGREDEALPLLETAHAFAVKTARPCDMGGDAVIVERLIDLDTKRGNAAAVKLWTASLEHLCKFLDGPVVEAFRSMARGHVARKTDPAAAAGFYATASQRWKEVGWREFELRMVRAALDHGRRARGAAGPWPTGLESEASLERREKELDTALSHR